MPLDAARGWAPQCYGALALPCGPSRQGCTAGLTARATACPRWVQARVTSWNETEATVVPDGGAALADIQPGGKWVFNPIPAGTDQLPSGSSWHFNQPPRLFDIKALPIVDPETDRALQP